MSAKGGLPSDSLSHFTEALNLQPLSSTRNVKSFLRAQSRNQENLTMGLNWSAIRGGIAGSSQAHQEPTDLEKQLQGDLEQEQEEEDIRPPAKRRKPNPNDAETLVVGVREPLAQVMNENRNFPRRSSKVQSVDPSDFYGRPKTARGPRHASRRSPRKLIEKIKQFRKTLRVDVRGISPLSVDDFHVHMNGDEQIDTSGNVYLNINIKCTATLFFSNDEDDAADPVELSRIMHTGLLRITVGANGRVTRTLDEIKPFLFSTDELFVNRHITGHVHHKFADRYFVHITLQSLGSQELNWPTIPIPSSHSRSNMQRLVSEAVETGKAMKSAVILSSDRISLLDNPFLQRGPIGLSLAYRKLQQPSTYKIQLQIGWALPSRLPALPKPPPFEPSSRPSSKAAGLEDNFAALPTKAAEGTSHEDQTESRAQRRRAEPPTYNLKALSRQAQGKSPSVSPMKRRSVGETIASHSSIRGLDLGRAEFNVTYNFGRADAADNGTKQQHRYSSLECPFCGCKNRSFNELRLHLHGSHHNFKFKLRKEPSKEGGRATFFVEVVKGRPFALTFTERQRIVQIGKPVTLFDLNRHLEGDDPWMKAREGPSHNYLPELLIGDKESSQSSSPHGSRYSSPNTSHMEDPMDWEVHEPKPEPKRPVRIRKKLYVPKTKKPLFDTVTKRLLQPGEELPSSDGEGDEAWFHQKQRDIINDFTDITDDEKDYIKRYNPFISEKLLKCTLYLPNAILEFVEENKSWFARRDSRRLQFMRHMETLIMGGVMTQERLEKCIDILRLEDRKMQRRSGRGDIDTDGQQEEESDDSAVLPKQRGILDCICYEHIPPQDRVVCTGPKCPGRFFHRECATRLGRPVLRNWKCDSCVPADESQRPA